MKIKKAGFLSPPTNLHPLPVLLPDAGLLAVRAWRRVKRVVWPPFRGHPEIPGSLRDCLAAETARVIPKGTHPAVPGPFLFLHLFLLLVGGEHKYLARRDAELQKPPSYSDSVSPLGGENQNRSVFIDGDVDFWLIRPGQPSAKMPDDFIGCQIYLTAAIRAVGYQTHKNPDPPKRIATFFYPHHLH